MIIPIKILGGKEFSIEISQEEDVACLKKIIENLHGIPTTHQKLLLKGKPLLEGNALSSYNISESTKVNLVIKKGAPTLPVHSQPKETTFKSKYSKDDFWKALEKLLSKRFNQDEVKKIITQYQKDYSILVNTLSLDDIERLAKRRIELSSITPGT